MNLPILSRSIRRLILPTVLSIICPIPSTLTSADELECGSDIVALEKLTTTSDADLTEEPCAWGTHDSAVPTAPNVAEESNPTLTVDSPLAVETTTAESTSDVAVEQLAEPFAMVGPYLENSLAMVVQFQDWWDTNITQPQSATAAQQDANVATITERNNAESSIVAESNINDELHAIASEEPIDADPIEASEPESIAAEDAEQIEDLNTAATPETIDEGHVEEVVTDQGEDAETLDQTAALAQDRIAIPAVTSEIPGLAIESVGEFAGEIEVESELVGRVAEVIPVVIEDLGLDTDQQLDDIEPTADQLDNYQPSDEPFVADESGLETIDVEVLHETPESLVVEEIAEDADITATAENIADENVADNKASEQAIDELNVASDADVASEQASSTEAGDIVDTASTNEIAAPAETQELATAQDEIVDTTDDQTLTAVFDASVEATTEELETAAEIQPSTRNRSRATLTKRTPIPLEVLESGSMEELEFTTDSESIENATEENAVEEIAVEERSPATEREVVVETDEEVTSDVADLDQQPSVDDVNDEDLEASVASTLEQQALEALEQQSNEVAAAADAMIEAMKVVEVIAEEAEEMIQEAAAEQIAAVEPSTAATSEEAATATEEDESDTTFAIGDPLGQSIIPVEQATNEPAEPIVDASEVADPLDVAEISSEADQPAEINADEVIEATTDSAASVEEIAEIAADPIVESEPQAQEVVEEVLEETASIEPIAEQAPLVQEPIEQLSPTEIRRRKQYGPSVLIDTTAPENVDFRQTSNEAAEESPLVGGSAIVAKLHDAYMPYDLSAKDLRLWSVFPTSTDPLCLRNDVIAFDETHLLQSDDQAVPAQGDLVSTAQGDLVSTQAADVLQGSPDCLMGEIVWNLEQWTGQESPLWPELAPHQVGQQMTALLIPRNRLVAGAAELLASSWKKPAAHEGVSSVGQELLARAGAIDASEDLVTSSGDADVSDAGQAEIQVA